MPGFAVQEGAKVLCMHFGEARPTVLNANSLVKLGGSAAVSLDVPWEIPPNPPTNCRLLPSAGGPCATATWKAGSTRVTSMGRPLVIQGGTAICLPTGSPLTVTVVQSRVRFT